MKKIATLALIAAACCGALPLGACFTQYAPAAAIYAVTAARMDVHPHSLLSMDAPWKLLEEPEQIPDFSAAVEERKLMIDHGDPAQRQTSPTSLVYHLTSDIRLKTAPIKPKGYGPNNTPNWGVRLGIETDW